MTNRELRFVDFEGGVFRLRGKVISPRLVGAGVIEDSRDTYESWCNFPEGYSPDATKRFGDYEKKAEELGMEKFNKPELMRVMGEWGWGETGIRGELSSMREMRKEIMRQKPSGCNAFSLGDCYIPECCGDYMRAVLYLDIGETAKTS